MLIGQRSAEELKQSIGCVFTRSEVTTQEVKGRDLLTGLPKVITLNSNDMIEALSEPVEKVLEAVHMVLERTPPELIGDISMNGIVMSGGGSLLRGLDKLISSRTGSRRSSSTIRIACMLRLRRGKMLRELGNMQEGMINLVAAESRCSDARSMKREQSRRDPAGLTPVFGRERGGSGGSDAGAVRESAESHL